MVELRLLCNKANLALSKFQGTLIKNFVFSFLVRRKNQKSLYRITSIQSFSRYFLTRTIALCDFLSIINIEMCDSCRSQHIELCKTLGVDSLEKCGGALC